MAGFTGLFLRLSHLKATRSTFILIRVAACVLRPGDVVAAGVVIDPLVLVVLGVPSVDTSIKAGSYEVREGISALGLFEKTDSR